MHIPYTHTHTSCLCLKSWHLLSTLDFGILLKYIKPWQQWAFILMRPPVPDAVQIDRPGPHPCAEPLHYLPGGCKHLCRWPPGLEYRRLFILYIVPKRTERGLEQIDNKGKGEGGEEAMRWSQEWGHDPQCPLHNSIHLAGEGLQIWCSAFAQLTLAYSLRPKQGQIFSL